MTHRPQLPDINPILYNLCPSAGFHRDFRLWPGEPIVSGISKYHQLSLDLAVLFIAKRQAVNVHERILRGSSSGGGARRHGLGVVVQTGLQHGATVARRRSLGVHARAGVACLQQGLVVCRMGRLMASRVAQMRDVGARAAWERMRGAVLVVLG